MQIRRTLKQRIVYAHGSFGEDVKRDDERCEAETE